MTRFDIVSQGEELTSGSTVDTNAAWIAAELRPLGLEVARISVVGDELDDIRTVLSEAAARSPVVICTGGLGPTTDDLTTEAAGLAFGRALYEDATALEQVESRYRSRNRVMPPANRKQAILPVGSVILENHWGTAPGYRLDVEGASLFFLPGVPSEMKKMFHAYILPDLTQRFAIPPRRTILLRCLGLPESEADQRMHGFARPGVTVGYRAHLPEIHVKLHVEPGVAVDELIAEARARLGDFVFTVDGGPIAEVVGTLLNDRGATVATAESCTGGRIGAALTAVAGSSAYYLGGAVVYSNAEKTRQCGVPAEVIEAEGAVSEAVARGLAEGIRERVGSTYGVGVTGIAGPGGGTPETPVGTVHIAVAGPNGTTHRRLRLPFDRERVQSMSAALAMDLLRRRLDGTS